MFSMANRTHSEKTKEKQSIAAIGREHNYPVWNKGLTKESDPRLAALAQQCSNTKKSHPENTWLGKKHSAKSVEAMRNAWATKINDGYVSHWLGKERPTKGGKWWNNGILQRVEKECPDGWVAGRLPSNKH